MPREFVERAIARGGEKHSCASLNEIETALVVVDMQSHFLDTYSPVTSSVARGIVPNVNRVAVAVCDAGDAVSWLQPDLSRRGGVS